MGTKSHVKVAVVTDYPVVRDEPTGGVEAVSVNLVRALSRLGGLEIHVVTTSRACESFDMTTCEGVSIHRLPWVGGRTLTHAIGRGRRQKYVATLAQGETVGGRGATETPLPPPAPDARMKDVSGAIPVRRWADD